MENTDKIITEETNLVIPEHVALILDGNGRWAKKRGLPRTAGHKCMVFQPRTGNAPSRKWER